MTETTDAMTETTDAMADEPGTIVDVAVAAGSFDTLVAAVTAADLVDALSADGPLTVLAPTDDAFAALPAGLVDCLLLPENKDALTSILTYHVIEGAVMSGDLTAGDVPTLQGENVTVDLTNGVMFNNATVIQADVEASNGVIHAIDAVLVPPSIDVRGLPRQLPVLKHRADRGQLTSSDPRGAGRHRGGRPHVRVRWPACQPTPEPNCELCEATPFTEWFHSDDLCWIAECDSCGVPMVVWRTHDPSPPAEIRAALARAADRGRRGAIRLRRSGSTITSARFPTTTTPMLAADPIGPPDGLTRHCPRPDELLPHRPPFLFVDEMLSIVPGESASGIWRLTGEEFFFAGHFPGPSDAAGRADVRGDRSGRCRRRAGRREVRGQACRSSADSTARGSVARSSPATS